jgi:hypothetical protein
LGAVGRSLIEPLQKLLNKPLLAQFVSALEKLTHPEHRFKDWLESLKVSYFADAQLNVVAIDEEQQEKSRRI